MDGPIRIKNEIKQPMGRQKASLVDQVIVQGPENQDLSQPIKMRELTKVSQLRRTRFCLRTVPRHRTDPKMKMKCYPVLFLRRFFIKVSFLVQPSDWLTYQSIF